MSEYIFGAHILEILTTGMYQDSRMIFREYIQNSCDSIDKAYTLGILAPEEGRIEIEIDSENRNIIITDNGTGIKAEDFVRVMGSVADSEKKAGYDKGFRGIGRLCGLAYCSKLIFTSKFKGENIISRLVCDTKIMRRLLNGIANGERHTASYVLSQMNEFITENTKNIASHYFTVELVDINSHNESVLDSESVRDYLYFAAPVPYHKNFSCISSKIYEHSRKLGFKINEYNIYLNDEQLFRRYTREFKTRPGADEIFDIVFEDFRDKNNNLIAWLWFGISRFRGIIDKKCLMRGIRLRRKNIQVGNENALQKLFTEDRGIYYFAGEVFCVSDDLILNAHRDYFIDNSVCSEFEELIRNYFIKLKKIYYDSSRVNSAFRKMDRAEERRDEIISRLREKNFAGGDEEIKALEEIRIAEDEASSARDEIDKLMAENNEIMRKIIQRIEKTRERPVAQHTDEDESESIMMQIYSQREQNLLNQIFGIITKTADRKTAQKIITEIKNRIKPKI